MGGNEIINSARTAGYLSSGDCPVNWIVCPPCDGVADAQDDDEYTADNISSAPWYDVEDEPTHRFLGVHALSIEGITDSTRTGTVAEGITDGGVVGQIRHAVRQVRARVLLSARGEDALESGLSWLDAALEPDACGQHGASCGAVDACFYIACPPAREDITVDSIVWNDPLTNHFTNPRAVAAGSNPWGSLSGGTASYITTFPGPVSTARRFTVATAGSPARAVALQMPEVLLGDGASVRVLMTVNASAPFSVASVRTRPAANSPASETVLSSTIVGGVIPAGVSTIEAWGNAFVGAPSGTAAVVVLATPATVGDTLDITQIIVEYANSPSAIYFDGSTPDSTSPPKDYSWTGTQDASTSTYRSGTATGIPDEAAYQDAVDDLFRSLHNVTCISGPLIEQKIHRGMLWGYIVEFTLAAGTPWVYGITKPIALSPSLPIVIQDVPFNLVPYPSAELASGTVVAATNLSNNPSVETDAANWAKNSSVVVAADVVGARSTSLASDGSASFRSRFTASNTSAVAGTITAENTSATFASAVAGQRMSISMWVSAQVVSGTAVIQKTEVFAIWRNGSTVLRTDLVGTAPAVGGGAVASKSMAVPVGATNVIVQAKTTLTSWSTGAIVDLYADAVAITVP